MAAECRLLVIEGRNFKNVWGGGVRRGLAAAWKKVPLQITHDPIVFSKMDEC